MVCECIQRRATKLVNGLQEMSHEEWPGTLDLSSLEQRMLRGDLIALYSFPRRGRGEMEQLIISPRDPVVGFVGILQSCTWGV